MNVGQAQTFVNDDDELNEPQDAWCRTGQYSNTTSAPEICCAAFRYCIHRLFQNVLCYFTAREEVHDSEAGADRVWTIKESLLSKRDSHKNSSGSNVNTRNPIQDMNGGLTPCWRDHHSWVS